MGLVGKRHPSHNPRRNEALGKSRPQKAEGVMSAAPLSREARCRPGRV